MCLTERNPDLLNSETILTFNPTLEATSPTLLNTIYSSHDLSESLHEDPIVHHDYHHHRFYHHETKSYK